jgi:hypothetical protein
MNVTSKTDSMMQKWLSLYWHEITINIHNYWFVITAALGSLVGLQAETKLSFWRAFLVWSTGFATTLMVALFASNHFKLGIVEVSVLSYFMGTVGNKITFAFILLVERMIKDPRQTFKDIKEILLLIKIIK